MALPIQGLEMATKLNFEFLLFKTVKLLLTRDEPSIDV